MLLRPAKAVPSACRGTRGGPARPTAPAAREPWVKRDLGCLRVARRRVGEQLGERVEQRGAVTTTGNRMNVRSREAVRGAGKGQRTLAKWRAFDMSAAPRIADELVAREVRAREALRRLRIA